MINNWFCQRCKELGLDLNEENDKKPQDIQCQYCTDLHGIITNTNIGWTHPTCINYFPEVEYRDRQKRII